MTPVRPRGLAFVLMPVIWLLCLSAAPVFPAAGSIEIRPKRVEIGILFGGKDVEVIGGIPQGSDVVIEMVGEKVEEDLMRKGRRWDIWMNVSEIDVDGAPRLYYAMSSRPELLQNRQEHPWGYGAIRKSVFFRVGPEGVGRRELFREFVRLKEEKGLYGEFPGKVKISPSGQSGESARAVLHLPTRIAPGTYEVRFSIVNGNTTVERRSGSIEVMMTGIPAFLDVLASAHRTLYGGLAVMVAAFVGLLSGIAFRSRGKGTTD